VEWNELLMIEMLLLILVCEMFTLIPSYSIDLA
jgi:hypothetical protein